MSKVNGNRVDTIVVGGKVVTPSEVYEASVAILGEKIVAIGPYDLLPKADIYIDASNKYILPGLMDCHVHLDRIDSYELGSIAAAHSGITTLLPFGVPFRDREDTLPDAINRHREEINSTSVLDFAFHFMISNQPRILEGLPKALEMGVKSYKMFMTYKKGGGMSDDSHICNAMEMVAKGNGVMQLHCESGNIIDYLEDKLMADGCVHPTDFPKACPDWAEEEAINRAIQMGAVTNCPVYVVHLSSHLGLERIKRAQADGNRVWTETCPQYLLLSDDELAKVGPLAKIGPPLRPSNGIDQAALWKGLELGYISALGSDHSPSLMEDKKAGWDNIFVNSDGKPIPFGAPGIETLAPLAFSEGVIKRDLTLPWLARVMSENPARIFGLYPQKGVIQVGSDADLSIFDPSENMEIHAKDHLSNVGYTLFEGWKITGKPWMSLLRGKVLLNKGKLEQKPGYGRFLECKGPRSPLGGSIK